MVGRYARYAKRRRGYAQRGGYSPPASGPGPQHQRDNNTLSTGVRFVDLDPCEERDPYMHLLPKSLQHFLLFEAEINWNTKDTYLAHSQQRLSWATIEQQLRHMDREEYREAYPDMGVPNPFRPYTPPPQPRFESLW